MDPLISSIDSNYAPHCPIVSHYPLLRTDGKYQSYVADELWGRFKTITIFGIAMAHHMLCRSVHGFYLCLRNRLHIFGWCHSHEHLR
eukprot:1179384-Amorphochlora_amoeboformis.AAC.3